MIKKYKNVSFNLIIDSSIVIILFVLYSIMLTIYKNKSKKKGFTFKFLYLFLNTYFNCYLSVNWVKLV